MIEDITPLAADVVEVVASPSSLALGCEGMVFGQMEAPAAQQLLGPAAHQEAATAVLESLQRL